MEIFCISQFPLYRDLPLFKVHQSGWALAGEPTKGEWQYMTVLKNRSNQLIGSNWIRKANPERPTVGHGLPTVGRVLPSEGCLPWGGWGPWRKMYGFSLHEGVQLIGISVLVFSLNLVVPIDHITQMHKICRKTIATDSILSTLGKEYLGWVYP